MVRPSCWHGLRPPRSVTAASGCQLLRIPLPRPGLSLLETCCLAPSPEPGLLGKAGGSQVCGVPSLLPPSAAGVTASSCLWWLLESALGSVCCQLTGNSPCLGGSPGPRAPGRGSNLMPGAKTLSLCPFRLLGQGPSRETQPLLGSADSPERSAYSSPAEAADTTASGRRWLPSLEPRAHGVCGVWTDGRRVFMCF